MGSPEKTRIGHLVIITGPTSSGKSTLLASMRNGELNEKLKSLLPAGAAAWEEYPCSAFDGSVKLDESKEGMVLHYDIMRPFKKFLDSYEDDLASGLMDLADNVTIVFIKPDRDVLLRQLQEGEFKGGKVETGKGAMYLRSLLTRSMRVIPSSVRQFVKNVLVPGQRKSITDFNKILYFRYQESGWLENWYDKFEAFIARKKENGTRIRIFFVKPGTAGRKNWVLIE
ncbi:hypothetical protein [Natronogracilivirga saccharolytica]|uniref:Uncharacterized protein n=1 Tax=Natronogracilivirga saccharolytica TaxID=2812953 RepID=A0A8J7RQ89_9BACT|nr:hypothetical protein [Natronogracilivirga saccharolytica]MBP3193939.1 hypothetical protein [Natronogracilivirga saccharolytica]